jgi:hypothetical protein
LIDLYIYIYIYNFFFLFAEVGKILFVEKRREKLHIGECRGTWKLVIPNSYILNQPNIAEICPILSQYIIYFILCVLFYLFCFMALWRELRVYILSQATSPFFCDGLGLNRTILQGLVSNCDPPDLCLLSSYNYKHEPPAPGNILEKFLDLICK